MLPEENWQRIFEKP